jgi:hypothetical protein
MSHDGYGTMARIDIFTSPSTLPPLPDGLPRGIEIGDECLFKYDNGGYLRKGSVKITTLEECRRTCEHFGDPSEGLKSTGGVFAPKDDPEGLVPPAKLLGLSPEDMRERWPAAGTGSNGVMMRHERMDNAFVFCTACRESSRMLENYGRCTRIHSPRKFFEILDDALRRIQYLPKLDKLVVGHVGYRPDRQCSYKDNPVIHATYIKTLDYQHEYEVRALWVPLENVPITPIYLSIPQVIELVEEI